MFKKSLKSTIFGTSLLTTAFILPVSAAEWQTGTWDHMIEPVSRASNLALTPGCTIAVANNDGIEAGDVNILTDVEVVRNGTINHYACKEQTYGVGDGAVMTFTFSGPVDLKKITVFTKWGDNGRIGFTFTSVDVLSDGAWRTLENSALAEFGQDPQGDNKGNGRGDFGDGETVFATGVTGVRLNFGTVYNNGIGVNEIEIVGSFCDPIEGVESTWDRNIYEPGDYQLPSVRSITDTENVFAESGVVLNVDPGDVTNHVPDSGFSSQSVPLINGVFVTGADQVESCWLGNGAELEFLLPGPREIGRLRFYTAWNDANRDGFQLKGIFYKLEGDAEYRMLPGFVGGYYGISGYGTTCNTGRLRVDVERADGHPLIENAVAVKIVFGIMDCGGTGFVEVQSLYATSSVWAYSDWTGELDRTDLGSNLLRRASTRVTVSNNETKDGPEWWDESAVVALTDGRLNSEASNTSNSDKHMLAISSDALLQCDFSSPVNISSVGFWTKWDGGRDGQEIAAVSARFENGPDFVQIRDIPCMHAGQSGLAEDITGHLHYTLVPKSGEFLLRNVSSLRIQFGHQENGWSGYQEIEVFGERCAKGLMLLLR